MAGGKKDETITVHLRLKPTKKDAGYLAQDDVDPSIVRMVVPTRGVSVQEGYVNNSKTNYNFRFDSVLPKMAKQGDVFDTVGRDAVANVLDGINSTIFAYGQTGSGKTFTITGGVDSYDQRGLIPLGAHGAPPPHVRLTPTSRLTPDGRMITLGPLALWLISHTPFSGITAP